MLLLMHLGSFNHIKSNQESLRLIISCWMIVDMSRLRIFYQNLKWNSIFCRIISVFPFFMLSSWRINEYAWKKKCKSSSEHFPNIFHCNNNPLNLYLYRWIIILRYASIKIKWSLHSKSLINSRKTKILKIIDKFIKNYAK